MVPDADIDEETGGEGVEARLDEAAASSIDDDDGEELPAVFSDGTDVALMDAFKISASIENIQ